MLEIEVQADEISSVPGGVSLRGKTYRLVAVAQGDTLTVVGCRRCEFRTTDGACLAGDDAVEAKFSQLTGDACTSFNGGRAYWEEFSPTSSGKGIHDITRALCR